MKKFNKRTPVHILGKNLEFEIPSWNLIYRSLLNLAEAIRESGFAPDIIVGVSRGGWLPARIMSDLLEKPKLGSVATEFYVGVAETRGKPTITQMVSVSVKDKKILVVDDVADTGESLKLVSTHLKKQGAAEIRVATIYYKPWCKLVPEYYEKETYCWVVFPWERKEAVRKTLEKFRKEGRTVDDTKEKLIIAGLDRKLVERFIEEISGKHLD